MENALLLLSQKVLHLHIQFLQILVQLQDFWSWAEFWSHLHPRTGKLCAAFMQYFYTSVVSIAGSKILLKIVKKQKVGKLQHSAKVLWSRCQFFALLFGRVCLFHAFCQLIQLSFLFSFLFAAAKCSTLARLFAKSRTKIDDFRLIAKCSLPECGGLVANCFETMLIVIISRFSECRTS